MKHILLLTLIIILALSLWLKIRPPVNTPTTYRLDYAEGTCTASSQCTWAGEGCGGGHGLCTNTPEKYKGMASDCDINNTFPANQGYTCTCIMSQRKCGWVK